MALAEVKLMLSIDAADTSKDALISQLIDNTNQAIQLYINEQALPDALQWVADEITAAKYNQLDALGVQSERVDSVSYTYRSDIFSEYKQYMDLYLQNNQSPELPRLKML